MKNIYKIAYYTYREALSRKIFLAFFGISTFVLIVFGLIFLFSGIEDLMSITQIEGGERLDFTAKIIDAIKVGIAGPLYGVGLFLAIFAASSFIPNMLEKGSIDVLLSKPLSRNQVILGKFFGGLYIVLINIAYLVIGIWFLLGFKFGNWDASFLMVIPTVTFTFAVLYALIILIGILTQSSILAMMLSYLSFMIFSPILLAREEIAILIDSKFVEYLLDALYYLIPKTSELASITTDMATGDFSFDYQPFLTSAAFMILSLVLSIFIFSKKDY
ncbi:MAG: ABC transporter permease subunit [Ignavibacteria bacterium]|jgi:ABC-type transport system involved in multi-copper enzyme maturation permease subunit